jgi:hypothetical protein
MACSDAFLAAAMTGCGLPRKSHDESQMEPLNELEEEEGRDALEEKDAFQHAFREAAQPNASAKHPTQRSAPPTACIKHIKHATPPTAPADCPFQDSNLRTAPIQHPTLDSNPPTCLDCPPTARIEHPTLDFKPPTVPTQSFNLPTAPIEQPPGLPITRLLKLLPRALNDFLSFPTRPDPSHPLHQISLCHTPSVDQPHCANSLHASMHGTNRAG